MSSDDDPLWDATELVHPAWWRGNDAGIQMTVRLLTKALDGLDDGAGVYGYAPLEQLRRRLIALASGALPGAGRLF